MKKIKKTVLTLFVLLMTGFISMAQNEKIPVTSSSEKAVQLYHQAWSVMENAEIEKAHQLLENAIKEDPEFFMGHFTLAFNNLYFENRAAFKEHAEKALNSNATLSKGEMLLKTALRRLNENPKADMTDVGKNLVEIFPTDETAYYMLASFQGAVNDLKGTEATYNKLLEITDNPAPVYNMLGYNYLRMDDHKAAEKAFDKYIELVPDHPNPYDSKGDYFMAVKDYENAYNSFMKAHELDNAWSYSKAMEAKKLMEKCEQTDIEKEKQAVLKVLQEQGDEFAAFNKEKLFELHIQDETATRLAGSTVYSGWDEIKNLYENYFEINSTGSGRQSLRNSKEKTIVKVNGNNAWVVCDNIWKWEIEGQPRESKNKQIAIFEKVNGNWKFALNAFVEDQRNKIIGAWKLVELRVISDDTVQYSTPGNISGSQIKMWSDGYFTVVGKYRINGEQEQDNFVGGSYSLDGKRYIENIHYHTDKNYVGTNPKMIMELKGDTLIQTWPVDDDGIIDQNNYSVEKYVRSD